MDILEKMTNLLFVLIFLVILDVILKGLALWKAARRGQKIWFILLLIINSLGIFPSFYLITNAVRKAKEKRN